MKICLVAHFAYGAIKGGGQGHIGGVERQAALMSRWLAGRGHEVSLVTWESADDPGDETIDGVRVIKTCGRDAGLPGLRFFVPRWSSLVRALRRADADIYYHNCAEYVTGQVALWCRMHTRKFVFSVASDPECDPALPILKSVRERVLYRYGLRHADAIVVQTTAQQRKMAEGFGLSSSVLSMPCQGPDEATFREPVPPTAGDAKVVWVGRIAPVKRLEVLLDIAAAMPAVTFEIVGKPDAPAAYVSPLIERARGLDNVKVRGAVAPARMADVYRGASLLCCTSSYEGFPNTFLEAWSHGVPVVSTVDPDNLIADRETGRRAESVDALIAGIDDLVSDPDSWRRVSSNARRLFCERYAVDAAMRRFEQFFLETTSGAMQGRHMNVTDEIL